MERVPEQREPEQAQPTEPEAAEEHPSAAPQPEAAQVAHDIDELLAKAQERDEYVALAQRVQADFENYRKRAGKEAAAAEARGIGKLANELLPVMDNLALALAAAEEDGASAEKLVEGLRLVHSQLEAALARFGVDGYSPEGERFDPELHEAMAQREVEGAEPGTVVEVFQPGYRINGEVLRPARVVVAG